VLAGFLLVIFAFGITPKRTLHNLVATHKDGSESAAAVNDHDVTLSKATFNCKCDNLISESPFVTQAHSFYISLDIAFPAYCSDIITVHYSSAHFSFGLRGPPVV
jgi:hypothetical protein